MIQNINLVKKMFVYGDIKYFSDYKDKLIKHFIKCLLFTRKVCVSNNGLYQKKKTIYLGVNPQNNILKGFSDKDYKRFREIMIGSILGTDMS